MTAEIIKFPNSTQLDNVAYIRQVASLFRERALPPPGTMWTQKELLVSLLESLRNELKITKRDISHYGIKMNEDPLIYSFLQPP